MNEEKKEKEEKEIAHECDILFACWAAGSWRIWKHSLAEHTEAIFARHPIDKVADTLQFYLRHLETPYLGEIVNEAKDYPNITAAVLAVRMRR